MVIKGHLVRMYPYSLADHVDMRHASWSYVPRDEKQELIDRVRADFVLDWTRDNHREIVVTHLADKYMHIIMYYTKCI
ncbi:hypothetical protein I3842_15G170500 [Carya illinoinensis]|uniref:Uncharacterized protein n=1 Tax=Carya illinoinensis TaxID=32201 RepID=A0A922A8I7_CARIL|nr:hypothetical protein I3842_15G170500 [Carya illinoinensis]